MLAWMYLADPLKPSTMPWKSPGASGVSTSATTAILISVGVIPMSDAFVALSLWPGVAAAATAAVLATAIAIATTSPIQRDLFIGIPPGAPMFLMPLSVCGGVTHTRRWLLFWSPRSHEPG